MRHRDKDVIKKMELEIENLNKNITKQQVVIQKKNENLEVEKKEKELYRRKYEYMMKGKI